MADQEQSMRRWWSFIWLSLYLMKPKIDRKGQKWNSWSETVYEKIMLFYLAKLLFNEAKNWPKGPNRTVYGKMIVFYSAKLLCNKAKNWQKGPKKRWLTKNSPWEEYSLYLMKPKLISSEVLPIHPHLLPYLSLKPPHFGVFGTGYSTHLLQSASILSFLVWHSVIFYPFFDNNYQISTIYHIKRFVVHKYI